MTVQEFNGLNRGDFVTNSQDTAGQIKQITDSVERGKVIVVLMINGNESVFDKNERLNWQLRAI